MTTTATETVEPRPIPENYVWVATVHRSEAKGAAWLVEDHSDWHGGEGGNHSAWTTLARAKADVRTSWGSVRWEQVGPAHWRAHALVEVEA